MTVDQLVVKIIGDTSAYVRSMNQVAAATAKAMAAGKNPLKGVDKSVIASLTKYAVAYENMAKAHERETQAYTRNRAWKEQEFNKRQAFALQEKQTQLREDVARNAINQTRANQLQRRFNRQQKEQERRFKSVDNEIMRRHIERQNNQVVSASDAMRFQMAAKALGMGEPKSVTPKAPKMAGPAGQAGVSGDKNIVGAAIAWRLVETGVDAVTSAVQRLANAMINAGKNALQLGMDYEELGIQIEVLAGGANKGKQFMKELLDVAVNTPFQVKEVMQSAKEIRAFGYEMDEVIPILKTLGDVSAGSGTNMNRLILALGQTKTAGRLLGQEYRQFLNSNIPIIEALTQVTGQNEAQIKRMIETGQIGYSEVAKAFNLMTAKGGMFGGMMDRMSHTTKGQWRAMLETFEVFSSKAGLAFLEGIGGKGMFTTIKEGFSEGGQAAEQFRGAAQNLKAGVMALGLSIKEVFGVIINFIKANKDAITIILYGVAAVKSYTVAMAAWAVVVRIVIGLLAILRVSMLIITGIFVVSQIVSFGATLSIVLGIFTAIGWIISQIGRDLQFLFAGAGDRLGESFKQLGATFTKVWGGIKDAVELGDFEGAINLVFKAIEYAFRLMIANLRREWILFIDKLFPGSTAANLDSFAQLKASGATAWIQRNSPFWNESDESINKRREARDKKIMLEHSRATNLSDFERDSEIRAIMSGPEGVRKHLEKMTNDLRDRAKEKQIDNMIKENAVEIQNIESQMAHNFWGTFVSDVATHGPAATALSYFSKAYGIQGADMKGGNLRFSPDFLTSDGTGGMRFGISNITKGQVDQSTAIKLANELNKLNPRQSAFGVTLGMGTMAGPNGLGGYNKMPVPYSISPLAKEIGDGVRDSLLKGEGGKFDHFLKEVGLIEEARTGLTYELRNAQKALGPFMGAGIGQMGSKHSVLTDLQASTGFLSKYEALRNLVGNAMEQRPAAMEYGSSAAQSTINYSQTQQTSVMEEVRNTLVVANEIQKQAQVYRAQVVEALHELVIDKPGMTPNNVAPMPRAVGVE